MLRVLTDDDLEQAWRLSMLAFGGDPAAVLPSPDPARTGSVAVGAFDSTGRLIGKAVGLDHVQWWGGRPVPMLGIAGVAVLPDARGQGLLPQLMDLLVAQSTYAISVLFPTAAGIYRRLGWEVVATLDHTPVPLSALPRRSSCTLRAATEGDLSAIQELYAQRGARTAGLLTRTGPCFPTEPKGAFASDVVTLAVEDGRVTGYVSYDRGRGYRGGGQLRLEDCVTSTPTALRSLLSSLGSWDSVVDSVLWRGSTDDLALQLSGPVPPPTEVQPWMLRVLDPVAAVAARGFGPGGWHGAFAVAGQGFVLEVADGRGSLGLMPADGLPLLAPQGLSLLFAGVAAGRLLAAGLLDRPVPGLEAAFAGPRPEILDYF